MNKTNVENNYAKVCRTCLEEIKNDSNFSYLDTGHSKVTSTTLRYKLQDILPEVNLDITPNAVLCSDCASMIDIGYNFKERCLQVEDQMRSLYQKIGSSINAVDLAHLSQNDKSQNQNKIHIKQEIEMDEECQIEDLDATLYDAIGLEAGAVDHFLIAGLQEKEDFPEVADPLDLNRDYQQENAKSPTLYKCYECNYSAQYKYQLLKHSKIHRYGTRTGDNVTNIPRKGPYKCSKCNYCSFYKHNLIAHIANHELEESNDETYNHIASRQQRSKLPYKCNECNYFTHYRGSLFDHKKMHSESKPFKCPRCTFASKVKRSLDRHMETHSTRKPFTCTSCGFKTARKDYLRIHQRIHTGEKPYKCTRCNYRSSQNSTLKQHMERHDNFKSFKCYINVPTKLYARRF